MSDTQSTAQLNFKSNMAPLIAAGKKMDEIFGVSRFKQFGAAVKDAQAKVKDLARTHEELVEQMVKVEHGSEAYKKLAKNLDEVEKKAGAAQRQIQRLQEAQSKTGIGRVAGFAGQAAGQAAGSMRGASYAAMGASGAMGLGAIGGALGAAGIPMMAAAQQYGQYLQQQQAIAAAMPYMTGASSKHPIITKPGGPANPGGKPGGTIKNVRTDAQASLIGLGGEAFDPKAVTNALTNAKADPITKGVKTLSDMHDKSVWKQTTDAVGEVIEDVATAVTGGGKDDSGPKTSRTRTFDSKTIGGLGSKFGMSSTEAIQFAGGMSASAARPMDSSQADLGMALSRGWGVGGETSGGLLKGARRAGGQGSAEELAGLFAESLTKGLEGSEINDALQAQAGFMEAQARYGTKIDAGSLVGAESRLQNAGISNFMAGPMAQQIMGGVTGKFREGGGGKSAMDLMLMKQAGYTGRGGPEEWAKYANMMEDPTTAMNASMGLMGQMQGSNISPELKARYARSALRGVGGGSIGINQAKGLMGQNGTGGILGAKARGLDATGMAGFIDEAAGRTPGTLVGEAGITNQEISTGGKMTETVQNARKAMLNMAQAFENTLGPTVQELTEDMKNLSQWIKEATGAAGFNP